MDWLGIRELYKYHPPGTVGREAKSHFLLNQGRDEGRQSRG